MKGSLVLRRSILVAAAAGIVAAMLPSWFGRTTRRQLAERLVSVFSHHESARVVGRTYLALRPQEANRDVLVSQLSRDLNLAPWLARGGSLPALRRCIRRTALAERRRHRTLQMAGYRMSVTELRLCALAALAA